MSNEPQETPAAVVEYHGSLPVEINPFVKIPGLYTSWDIDTAGGKDRLALILRKADKTIDECHDCVAMVCHIGCHMVSLTNNDTGEVVQALRTVFITDDNHTIATVSSYVWQALGVIARVYGPPPWSPARPIKFRREKSRKLGYYFTIEPVG